jgi:hypothetical protein
MKTRNYLPILALILTLFMACTEAPKQDNSSENSAYTEGGYTVTIVNTDATPQTATPKTDAPVKSLTVVPKQQVGLIRADMTEADIKQAYGEKNVVRVDRGDVKTSVFPNSDKELEITWKKGQDFKKLETAIIRKGDWKTAEGIGIGTTVEELNAINGKPVELFQREENYAMVRWKNGKINPKLKAIVDTDTQKVIEMQIDF